jgi:hypothetical protein
MDHEVILRYLEIILRSWPLFIFVILFTYKRYLSSLLERVYKGSFYGASFEAIPMIQKEKIHQGKYFNSPVDRVVEHIKNNPKEAFDEYVKVYKYYIYLKEFFILYLALK